MAGDGIFAIDCLRRNVFRRTMNGAALSKMAVGARIRIAAPVRRRAEPCGF